MDERAETLCRRIELHRHYLRQGVDAARAVDCLQEIADAEAAFSDADTSKALQAAAELLKTWRRRHPSFPLRERGEALI